MSFSKQGYKILENIISQDTVTNLLDYLTAVKLQASQGGIRRIENIVPSVKRLAHSESLLCLVQTYLSGDPQLVRAIYFEKSPTNNWLVPWHQDKTVAVSEPFEKPGWGPWSPGTFNPQ
jgi:hypothetical protein